VRPVYCSLFLEVFIRDPRFKRYSAEAHPRDAVRPVSPEEADVAKQKFILASMNRGKNVGRINPRRGGMYLHEFEVRTPSPSWKNWSLEEGIKVK
jgi:hypothetical protein